MNHFSFVSLSKHHRIAAHPFAFRMLLKVRHDRIEGTRQIDIIAVDERKNITGNPLQTFVDGMYLSAVFFTHPISQAILVSTNNGDTIVRAAAINNDVFKVLVTLIQDT